MPTIMFYGPELEKERRARLVKDFTRAASEATGLDQSAFVVYLHPVGRENVGVGGELLVDKLK
jgi:4-oxalocrotonate tautomerase